MIGPGSYISTDWSMIKKELQYVNGIIKIYSDFQQFKFIYSIFVFAYEENIKSYLWI